MMPLCEWCDGKIRNRECVERRDARGFVSYLHADCAGAHEPRAITPDLTNVETGVDSYPIVGYSSIHRERQPADPPPPRRRFMPASLTIGSVVTDRTGSTWRITRIEQPGFAVIARLVGVGDSNKRRRSALPIDCLTAVSA